MNNPFREIDAIMAIIWVVWTLLILADSVIAIILLARRHRHIMDLIGEAEKAIDSAKSAGSWDDKIARLQRADEILEHVNQLRKKLNTTYWTRTGSLCQQT